MWFHIGDKVGIVNCSDAQPLNYRDKIEVLVDTLCKMGLTPILSEYIYKQNSIYSGTGEERAMTVMNFFEDTSIKAIFDISGGNIANEVLTFLDYTRISTHKKPFFGYSDLTTVLNAIYSQTEVTTYLYQIKNLIRKNKEEQCCTFSNTIFLGQNDLFDIKYHFVQGSKMNGIVIGGNIRCFLKLAGTKYMPSFNKKILLLESNSGEVGLMTTYLNQLKQMDVFTQINGIILGTFTEMEMNHCSPTIEEMVTTIVANKKLPIAKTNDIGHGADSKCIGIGALINIM